MPLIHQDNMAYLLGTYVAIVIDNKDPEFKGRLKVRFTGNFYGPKLFSTKFWQSPFLLSSSDFWAEPCLPSDEVFTIPTINSQVRVEFEEGDTEKPIWTGCVLKKSEPHLSAKSMKHPFNRSIKTEKHLELSLIDVENMEEINIKISNESAETELNPGPGKVNEAGINIIKSFEGFRSKAYKIKGEDKYTIGWGHHGPDVTENQVVTLAQAEAFFIQDINKAELGVKEYFKAPLTSNQFSALVSMAYNGGKRIFYTGNPRTQQTKLLQLTNDKKYKEAAHEILSFTAAKAPDVKEGLRRRRVAESALYLSDENFTKNPIKITMNNPSKKIVLDTDTIEIGEGGNTKFVLKKVGSSIVIDAEKIEIGQGATQAMVLGDSFKALYNSHTHTYTPGGGIPTTTTSPGSQIGPSHLSAKHKVE